jgi:hypothetical protein
MLNFEGFCPFMLNHSRFLFDDTEHEKILLNGAESQKNLHALQNFSAKVLQKFVF